MALLGSITFFEKRCCVMEGHNAFSKGLFCCLGVGLSFCVRRLGPFFKCVLRPKEIIFGVLCPTKFWRLRPRPNFYGVLHLTVFLHMASGVWSQNCGVWSPGFTKDNHDSYSSASASWNIIFGVSRPEPLIFGVLRPTGPLNPTPLLEISALCVLDSLSERYCVMVYGDP